MTIAALQRVVRLHPCPFVLGEFESVIEEFVAGRDRAEYLAPHLLRRLHLACDLVGPIVRHMAVRTACAHARAVGEMDRPLEFLIHVLMHLMTSGTEFLGIGYFQRGVERPPEHDAANETTEG